MNNTIEIRLVINGQEAITTLQLTDENVQKMAEHLNTLGASGVNSIASIREKYQGLVQIMEQTPLGSKEFDDLSMMTEKARVELQGAEAQMQKAAGTTGSARMAVTSFSQTLSDSTMFQNSFRMGMMSIGNNLDQLVYNLTNVKTQAEAMGTTMSKTLMGALTGPAGIMIGFTAVIALLQILPGLFGKSEQKIEDVTLKTITLTSKFSDLQTAIEKIEKEFKDLSVSEIKEKLAEVEVQIESAMKKSEKSASSFFGQLKSFLNERYGFQFDVSGEGEHLALLDQTKKTGENELANRSRVKVLDGEISDLRDAQAKKGTDIQANVDVIAQKELERTNILKTTNQRMDEQAATVIKLQRAQVDVMGEGYEKQKAAANAAFAEAKNELDQELRDKKISQEQYTEFLTIESTKRKNDLQKAEREKDDFSIATRSDALKRMAGMESADALTKINLDEKIAQSEAAQTGATEEKKLEITRDFALKRVQAESDAQLQILTIERNALEERKKESGLSEKEKQQIEVDLKVNDDAVKKTLDDLKNKKAEIAVDFKVSTGALPAMGTIAAKEAEISELQKEYSKATTDSQRADLQKRIDTHQAALTKMSYSEKQFGQDVYAGMKSLYQNIAQLINQGAQNQLNRTLKQVNTEKDAAEKKIEDQHSTAADQLEQDKETQLSYATTQAQKDAINKKYAADKKALDKKADADKAKIDADAAARTKEAQLEAFTVQKNLSYVTAIINVAEAVTKALASAPLPYSLILAGIAAAAGAVQVATIASSEPPGMAEGGIFKDTGKVSGPGGPKDDKVNARLSNGEFVVNADAAAKNIDELIELNQKNYSIADRIKITTRFLADRQIESASKYDSMVLPFARGGQMQLSAIGKLKPSDYQVAIPKVVLPSATQALLRVETQQPVLDTAKLENKVDKLANAIAEQPLVLELDGERITQTVEKQQRLNKLKKY